MDYRSEIDRLFHLDYGNVFEFAARTLLVCVGAWAIYSHTGWIGGYLWAAGFIAAHIVYFSILKTRPAVCTSFDYTVSAIALIGVMLSFIWLPVAIVGAQDMAMRMSALAAIGTFMIFLLRRADTMLWLVVCELAIVAVTIFAILAAILPEIDDRNAMLVTALSGLVLLGYFVQTLLIHRNQRIDSEVAAKRSLQAQKMEATGQLVGGVAHDFNNILTAVIGNLELFSVVTDKDEKEQFVATAKQSAEHAAVLIKQLLAYARQTHLEVRVQSLRVIFEQFENLSRRLTPSVVKVKITYPPENLMITVDQNQLITALINLLVNASDAVADGGRIGIKSRIILAEGGYPALIGYALEPGRYVEIIVQDDGPGIPQSILGNVTAPFFTTKPIGKGSGLGLSMVEGFARQSGGGLMIESSTSGARVSVFLPFAGVSPPNAATAP